MNLFSDEELAYNTKLKTDLFNLVSSGDSILFVGSGLSIPVGFPSWDGLLKQLETLALSVGTGFVADNNMRENDPLLYADKIKKHFSDNSLLPRYYNKLHETFDRKKPINFRESHKKLVRLPFPIILTTNYDTVLSDALLQVQSEGQLPLEDLCVPVSDGTRPLVSKLLLALHKSLDFPKKVAHLHGYFSRQNELVLTKSDYERCYNISLDGQTE
ncbi:MAG: SIR2 family protein, partial [Bacteriovoracaceae bacterium]